MGGVCGWGRGAKKCPLSCSCSSPKKMNRKYFSFTKSELEEISTTFDIHILPLVTGICPKKEIYPNFHTLFLVH